jgi:hypothetical protein
MLKHFENSRPSALNFKSFSQPLVQFFLTVGQNNFGNKIPLLFSTKYVYQCNVVSVQKIIADITISKSIYGNTASFISLERKLLFAISLR